MEVKIINNRPVKIWTNVLEESAMRQIENLTTLPFLHHHLAIMPDVHAGMGMPIGGVLACVDAVIPNAVGVDIGCGMCAVKTNWKVSELPGEVIRKKIMKGIRERIPLGMEHHKEAQDAKYLPEGHDIDKTEIVKRRQTAILHEVGTLGGGNHFIELQKDEEDNLWIMIHSGSRNLGKLVGDHYNKIAATLNERWHSAVSPDLHLPFLARVSKEFGMYWAEMKYCVDFALCNRKLMMERIEEVLSDSLKGIEFEPMINIAHNYAAMEYHYGKDVIVHRKGATLAQKGVVGIIPGSQGTASYIVEGLGNPDSFCSCSHGAGRVEYIELSIPELIDSGAKYVTFTCNAYSCGALSPNLVVGWMDSAYPMKISEKDGVAYDPSCVQHMVRISESNLAKGLVFGVLDVAKREIVWLEMPFTSQTIRGCSGNAVEALLTRLANKVSIGEILSLKAAAQGLSLSDSQDDADDIYTYEWALNPAEVTKLLAVN